MKITPIQLKALGRFRECCEDSASGGHDVPKEMMQRLAAVGVVRTLGFGRHETTEFGDWLLAQPPEAKVPTLAVPDGWKLVPAEPNDAMQAAGAQAVRIDTTVINKMWTGNAVFRAMLAAAPAAPAAQGDAKDTCAEMRALCSACGGTGDVHGLDGEWRGQCTCVHAWQQRAEKAEADLKQVNEWRAAALAENMQLGERWAKRITELEVQLARRGAPLSPEPQQASAAACAAGQSIAATPTGLVFMNDGTEPGNGELDCPACGGSGHAGDLPAGSTP